MAQRVMHEVCLEHQPHVKRLKDSEILAIPPTPQTLTPARTCSRKREKRGNFDERVEQKHPPTSPLLSPSKVAQSTSKKPQFHNINLFKKGKHIIKQRCPAANDQKLSP